MRIIAGAYKGLKLYTDKKSPVRPTDDFTREMLFNILQPIKPGALVLDLYGGTGAVALEFLSRGAGFVYINELSDDSIRVIFRNLEHAKVLDRAQVTKSDAVRKLKKVQKEGLRFDYIYIDPPYKKGMVKRTLTAVRFCDILNATGLIITEQEKEAKPVDLPDLVCYDQRFRGSKSLHFYKGA
ncbi:MAG: 16S rRNA (guanine(966)-N(2))-methyltransferase RsmD [Tissierellia bacterium]|jgi:16S rRNA (guanine966-N2)-methyltransferase|nr:16S rRNA (guanine(966)-N(2))-methyltransferase RsmD [Bacillota bacterium]NLK57858.1 16S rRNA (guanine(966)-N(2))-methyltransferase RsmD [Tissierellia bacterium]